MDKIWPRVQAESTLQVNRHLVSHPVQCDPGRRRDATMKTQGEIEASVCQCISRFQLEFMGRGPKDIQGHLLDDLVVVRLQGVLTAAEQQLVKALPSDKG